MNVYINTPQARIKLDSKSLLVCRDPGDPSSATGWEQIHLHDLDSLVVGEKVQITSQALGALMRLGKPVYYTDWRGRALGQLVSPVRDHARFRLAQFRFVSNAHYCLSLAVKLIQAKVFNQIRFLQRLEANHKSIDIQPELAKLKNGMNNASTAASVATLLGIEGAATAVYFKAWRLFLPEGISFKGRNTRPPTDPTNACISFGATLIYQEFVSAIHVSGLDPGLGFYHTPENGRWSLALDLMEPFRPCLVEMLALRLFTLKILTQKDFEPKKGGIYLNASGRKKFLDQYEKKMEQGFFSEQTNERTSLRKLIKLQVQGFKTALERPEAFCPFRMN